MKRTEAESIGEILKRVMTEGENSRTLKLRRASYMWIEIVGAGINRYTTRRYVTEEGIMHVYLSNAALKNELSFSRAEIVRNINDAMGENIIKGLVIH